MVMEHLNKKRTALIIIGAMIGILLASLDSNIVGTAMPKIIGSLKGFDLYTWPITAYLLTMTISMPLFGKLADVYGFKPVYLFGIIVFLTGSVLCGLSENMLQFILFRGLQGIGGAILISNTMAIIGIMFPPAERAKYGGFVSSASGLASLVGPFLGGLITDNFSWRWVFFVNIPLGMIALSIFIPAFPAVKRQQDHKQVDFAGAAIMIAGLVSMLLAFTWGGKSYSWNSFLVISLLVFSVIMLVLFGIIETKVKDPIIPMSLFKNAIFDFSAIEMFLINIVLMASIIFIPLFLQGVKGSSASGSGAIITPMLVSIIVGVMTCGIIVSKTCRYKAMSIIGFLIMGTSTVMLSFWKVDTGNSLVVVDMIIMGLGIGVVMAIFNVTAQNVFAENQMGTVTSSIQFFGRMGQTMASSVLGTILSTSMSRNFQSLDVSKFPQQLAQQLKNINTISSADAVSSIRAQIPTVLLPDFEKLLAQIKQILSNSIHQVLVICIAITLAALITALIMKEIPLSKKKEQHETENIVDEIQ
jgi:EmrB/QacA subfamily drug resistance transporter